MINSVLKYGLVNQGGETPPDFFYVGGVNRIRRYRVDDLNYVDQSPDLGNNVQFMLTDDDYIYCTFSNTRFIRACNLSDLTLAFSTAQTPANCGVFAMDDNFIYGTAVTTTTNNRRIRKYDKTDLTYITQGDSMSFGFVYREQQIVGDDIYFRGQNNPQLIRINKNTLNYIDGLNVAGTYGFEIKDGFIYAGDSTTNNSRVKKFEMDYTFTGIETPILNPDIHLTINHLKIHNNYLYVAASNIVKKYNLNDLSFTGIETQPTVEWNNIRRMEIIGNHLYVLHGFSGNGRIRKYNLNDLNFTGLESPDYGAHVTWLTMK